MTVKLKIYYCGPQAGELTTSIIMGPWKICSKSGFDGCCRISIIKIGLVYVIMIVITLVAPPVATCLPHALLASFALQSGFKRDFCTAPPVLLFGNCNSLCKRGDWLPPSIHMADERSSVHSKPARLFDRGVFVRFPVGFRRVLYSYGQCQPLTALPFADYYILLRQQLSSFESLKSIFQNEVDFKIFLVNQGKSIRPCFLVCAFFIRNCTFLIFPEAE